MSELRGEDPEALVRDEILREKIRRQLPPSQKRSGLLPFLNSAFGLWLMSALFITGGSAVYDHISSARAAAAAKEAARAGLTLEIASRIVRSHSLFIVQEFDRAYAVLNGRPSSHYAFGEFAFPVLIHNLIEISEPPTVQLEATLRDAVEISSLEGQLTGPDPSDVAVDRYRFIWCRIISLSEWSDLIPDTDKIRYGRC